MIRIPLPMTDHFMVYFRFGLGDKKAIPTSLPMFQKETEKSRSLRFSGRCSENKPLFDSKAARLSLEELAPYLVNRYKLYQACCQERDGKNKSYWRVKFAMSGPGVTPRASFTKVSRQNRRDWATALAEICSSSYWNAQIYHYDDKKMTLLSLNHRLSFERSVVDVWHQGESNILCANQKLIIRGQEIVIA